MWPSAFPPTCCGAVRTFAAPNGKRPPRAAQIGVAESDFYPHISILGEVGYAADQFKDLLHSPAFNATVGPTFQWNLLNYGRILNNERLQDAKFQELVAAYQNTVLSANEDVENGLVTFLKSAQRRAKNLADSVANADKAVVVLRAQGKAGTVDFTRLIQVEENRVEQQDSLAQAQGEIALGLIQVYRALGGGWQLRCTGCATNEEGPRLFDEAVSNSPPAPVSGKPNPK